MRINKKGLMFLFIILISLSFTIAANSPLPDNEGTNSEIDMTGNRLLWHLNALSSPFLGTSGYANDGVSVGGVVPGVSGLWSSNAVDFNGIDSAITTNFPFTYITDYPLSVALWSDFDTGQGTLFSLADNTANNKYIGVEVTQITSMPYYRIFARNGGGEQVSSPVPVNTSRFQHVVLNMFSSTDYRLYIDGVNTLNFSPSTTFPTINTFDIGRKGDSSPSSYYNGVLEEVAVWNRVLTETEITNIGTFDNDTQPPSSTPPPPTPISPSLFYPRPGFNEYDIELRGYFNELLTNVDANSRTLENGQGFPLTADLDNNGVLEIVAWDGANIDLFVGKTLDPITNINTNLASGAQKSMIIHNIDNDSYYEIIVAQDNPGANAPLEIYEYNGSEIYLEYSLTYNIGSPSQGYVQIGCNDEQNCFLLATTEEATGDNDPPLRVYGFNSTTFNPTPHVIQSTLGNSNNYVFCPPRIRSYTHGNIQNDGRDTYAISYIKGHRNGNEGTYLTSFYVHDNLSIEIIFDNLIQSSDIEDVPGGAMDCSRIKGALTSPISINIDRSTSNGLELITGSMIDSDNFRLFARYSNGNTLRQYPELLAGEGQLVSNPVKSNVFHDTNDGEDFCVLGYDPNSNLLDLLCASEQTSLASNFFTRSTTFSYSVPPNFIQADLTSSSYDIGLHSTQQKATLTNGKDLNEFISRYGVFELDFTAGDEIELIFQNPQDGATIMSDAEGVGRPDMLVITDTNIWYIDDKFTNSPASIDSENTFTNPCWDTTWKVSSDNITREVKISVRVTDDEGDTVSARAVLYYGQSALEQDSGWTSYQQSGTTFDISLPITTITPTSILRIYARDLENPTEPDFVEVPFSVGNNGIEFGDKTCSLPTPIDDIPPEDQEFNDNLITNQNDNAVYNSLKEFTSLTGLGTGLLWILILAGISLYVVTNFHDKTEALWAVVATWGVGLVIGVLLGLVSFGIMISIVALVLIIAGVFLWRKFFSAT